MCAVRALTEGVPTATWTPDEPGQSISGVVLRLGELDQDAFGVVPFVDLWTGGTGRVRIKGYGTGLRYALAQAEPKMGDTLTVWFDGKRTIQAGKWAGREVKVYTANIQRGHH